MTRNESALTWEKKMMGEGQCYDDDMFNYRGAVLRRHDNHNYSSNKNEKEICCWAQKSKSLKIQDLHSKDRYPSQSYFGVICNCARLTSAPTTVMKTLIFSYP